MADRAQRLADLTTLRVGGPARRLLSPSTADELVGAIREVWDDGEPWLVLGGGSNLLVGDDGFDGTVIRVLTRGIEPVAQRPAAVQTGESGSREAGDVRLRVQAGEPWDAVVAFAGEHGLSGIEALSGIPGSAGAAPVQNIGAYGQELSDTLTAIEFLDFESRERAWIPAADLGLGYRTSSLKRGRRGLVVAIELALERRDQSTPIAYPQLAASLGLSVGERAPLAAVRSAVLALRASKGMVLSPDDPDSVSAGSFFTNPIVSENFARGLPDDAPRWLQDPDAAESTVKLSAAWLIERAGIRRAFRLPGSRAAISAKHTLALVNTGDATAEEVAELARFVRLRVLAEFGISLQPEPQLVGLQL